MVGTTGGLSKSCGTLWSKPSVTANKDFARAAPFVTLHFETATVPLVLH